MLVRRMGMLAAALVIGALLAGCGGDGGGEDTTAAVLTPAAFKEQADAICARLLTDARAETAAWSKSGEKNAAGAKVNAEGETVTEISQGYYEAKAAALRELNPPPAKQDQFAKMLAALEAGIEEGKERRGVFISGSESFGEMAQLATELEIECAI